MLLLSYRYSSIFHKHTKNEDKEKIIESNKNREESSSKNENKEENTWKNDDIKSISSEGGSTPIDMV
jgi:hypothetical protein